MDTNDGRNDTRDDELQDMDWKEVLAYGCALSVGAVATLLVGASIGGLIAKGIKSIGVKKGAQMIARASKLL